MILKHVKLHKEHIGVTLSWKDIPDAHAVMYKRSKKRKMVSYEENNEIQKPPKKKYMVSKEVKKDVE